MPRSFKGTRIDLQKITIYSRQHLGSVVQFDIQFTDNDGRVHATTTHSIPLVEGAEITEAARNLLTKLVQWAESTHFDSTEGAFTDVSVESRAPDGIAEALRGTDEPGSSQG